jgi:hypothetical protein
LEGGRRKKVKGKIEKRQGGEAASENVCLTEASPDPGGVYTTKYTDLSCI